MRTVRRILVVALLFATPLMAAAACSTAPRPPASDATANAIYDFDDVVVSVLFILSVGKCLAQPGTCQLGLSFPQF